MLVDGVVQTHTLPASKHIQNTSTRGPSPANVQNDVSNQELFKYSVLDANA
jgi:hypothetical protein